MNLNLSRCWILDVLAIASGEGNVAKKILRIRSLAFYQPDVLSVTTQPVV